jgi:hypothetical protein
MSSKLCKRLRKLAQSATVGMPNVAYRIQSHWKLNPNFRPLDPASLEPAIIEKIQVLLQKDCTRYVYQQAKRQLI